MYQMMVAVLLATATADFTSSEVVGEGPPNHAQLDARENNMSKLTAFHIGPLPTLAIHA